MTALSDVCCRCDQPVHSGDRYCATCGAKVGPGAPRCHVCGRLVAEESRFCGACGAPRPGVRSFSLPLHPQEQVRQATVLFAFLTGLPALAAHLDIAEFKHVVDHCFDTVSQPILSEGGTIDKFMADALLALFGVPVASEDDPVRAVRAALAMLQAIERLNQDLYDRTGYRVGIKVGINTGKVLVGYVSRGTPDPTVVGDVVNTASRLQQAAPVGGILVGEATQRHLGDLFDMQPQSPLTVKGKRSPVTAYRVFPPGALPPPVAWRASRLRFVGRELEFNRLAACWRNVARPGRHAASIRDRAGEWVTVWGEAGIGKERLVQEFLSYVISDPCRPRIISVRGSSWGGERRRFEILRGVIRGLGGVHPHQDITHEIANIHALAARVAGNDPDTGQSVSTGHVARSLMHLACLSTETSAPPTPGTTRPVSLRHQGIAFLVSLCRIISEERPLVLVATNVQWAEDAALDFFESLGQDLPGRLLLITSARNELKTRRPDWGADAVRHRQLVLKPLSLKETRALVQEAVGEAVVVSGPAVRSLHQFTGGNPFFLTEVVRSYQERGEPFPDTEWEVPDSVEGVLQSRLDRLSFEEGLTLRAAAVMGPVFWAGAVEALLESDPTSVLSDLTRRGLIHKRTSSSIPGETEYAFDHALLVKVARGNLLDVVRQRYHRAAAEWLVDRGLSDGALDEDIARHWLAGGRLHEAALFFARAGGAAFVRHECEEAERLYSEALEVLTDAPGGRALGFEARILARRGESRRLLGDHANAAVDLEKAARAWEELQSPVDAGTSWYGAALAHLARDDADAAYRAMEAGRRALHGTSPPEVEALGAHLDGEWSMRTGRLDQAAGSLSRALFLRRKSGDVRGAAHTLQTLGRLHLQRGEAEKARSELLEVVDMLRRLGDLHGLGHALLYLGQAAEAAGRFSEALAHYHRGVQLRRKPGIAADAAPGLLLLGAGYLRCGYLGKAWHTLEQCRAQSPEISHPLRAAESCLLLGKLWLLVGDLPAATREIERSKQLFEHHDHTGNGGLRAGVELARCACRADRAADAYQQGTTLLNQIDRHTTPDVEARVLLLMGGVALARARPEQALAFLEELEWQEAAQNQIELRIETELLAGRIFIHTGRFDAALGRLLEAARLAARHDLVPHEWAALNLLAKMEEVSRAEGSPAHVRIDAPSDPWEPSAPWDVRARTIFRELEARVEDEEILGKIRRRARRNLADAVIQKG